MIAEFQLSPFLSALDNRAGSSRPRRKCRISRPDGRFSSLHVSACRARSRADQGAQNAFRRVTKRRRNLGVIDSHRSSGRDRRRARKQEVEQVAQIDRRLLAHRPRNTFLKRNKLSGRPACCICMWTAAPRRRALAVAAVAIDPPHRQRDHGVRRKALCGGSSVTSFWIPGETDAGRARLASTGSKLYRPQPTRDSPKARFETGSRSGYELNDTRCPSWTSTIQKPLVESANSLKRLQALLQATGRRTGRGGAGRRSPLRQIGRSPVVAAERDRCSNGESNARRRSFGASGREAT